MASWPEIREILERYEGRRARRLSDDVVVVSVAISRIDDRGGGTGEGGPAYMERDVCVRRGLIPMKDGSPGEEYVAIDASIGFVGSVDLMSAVGQAGQFDHCLLGYAHGDNGGALSVGTRWPAALIDPGDPVPFLMMLRTIASTAHGVIPELGREDGFFAFRAEQIRQSAWNAIRRLVMEDEGLVVERDLGHGFIFWTEGLKDPNRRHRMFVCQNNRGPGEHYVTFEIGLGAIQDVDMRRAAEAAAFTTGGIVYEEGLVTIRVSQHLTALTGPTFVACVLQLLEAAEQYLGG
jgi:hypothetical protein